VSLVAPSHRRQPCHGTSLEGTAWQSDQGSLSLIRGPMKGRLGDVALACLELGGQPRPGLGLGLVAGRRRRGQFHPPHPRQLSRTATRPCGCSPPPTPSTSAPDVERLADRRCCCSMSRQPSPGGGPWPSTSWSGPGRRALGPALGAVGRPPWLRARTRAPPGRQLRRVLVRSPMPGRAGRPGRVRTHPRGRLVVPRWHRCST
jgi:hypothetical protein